MSSACSPVGPTSDSTVSIIPTVDVELRGFEFRGPVDLHVLV